MKHITSKLFRPKKLLSRIVLPLVTIFFLFMTFMPIPAHAHIRDTLYGFDPLRTVKTNDPISAGGGEFRKYFSLLNLGGPLSVDFTLIYASNLLLRAPINDGEVQFVTGGAFYSNTFIRMSEFEGPAVTLPPTYINVFVSDDYLVFKDDGTGSFQPLGPQRYQIQRIGDHYYMMDPFSDLVYIFRSREFGWGPINRVGELLYLMDRNGNTLSYTYNADNNPTHIEDGLGRNLDLTYNGGGHLETVADGNGRTVTFNYQMMACNGQQKNELDSFTDSMGQTTTFDYFDPANFCDLIRGINRPLGNSHIDQTWTMNPKGLEAVDSQRDAYNNDTTLSFSLDANNNIETTVDYPDSTQRLFHHESERYPLNVTDPEGNQFTLGYNSINQITSITDRLGNITVFTYHTQSGKIASVTNAAGNTIRYTYASQNQGFTNPDTRDIAAFTFYNLIRIDYPDGSNEQFTYDADGNMLTYLNQAGKTWTYTYNVRGQVLTVTNPVGGITTYTYNANATLASSTDSDIGTTTYEYDAYKRLNRINHPDNTFVQMTYDLNDRITSITDENGNTYTYDYDANGNLEKVTDPAGNEIEYAHDLMDRITQFTDRLGNTATFAYDNMNRLASVTNANNLQSSFRYDPRGWLNQVTSGGQSWQTGYNDEGIVSSRISPLGHTTTYQSNNLGYTRGITNPLGQTSTLARDSLNRITAVTDPLSRATTYNYDGRGLLSEITMPVIGAAIYGRNDLGLLSQITDFNGSAWSFTYTNMGRPQSHTDPLNNQWQYTYDIQGRLAQTTYPDAGTQVRTYDSAYNLIGRQYSGGLDLQYTYNDLNRLLTANDIIVTRDAQGKITASNNSGTIFGATYDDGGRLRTVTYNNNFFTVTYTYDTITGLLSRVTDTLTDTQITFSYNNDRRLTGITRSNGITTTYTWDDAERLTRIQDGSIIDIQYTLNAAGQVTSADMTVPLDPASLVSVGTESFTFNSASQVSTAGYTFDSRGRRTASPDSTYGWDDASRLTNIDSTTLAYNGLGDLVTRTEAGSTTHYYYNYAIGLNPIVAEKDDTTRQFLRYYVWTPGGSLLYMIDAVNNNKVSFYHFDRTGSTLALTDTSGSVTDSYAYTPYGRLLQHNGSSEQPFTFVGRYGVRQEGPNGTFYHMRVRYYDAGTGRFVTREPIWPKIADPRQINPYQYALNEPVRYVDITGAEPFRGADLPLGFIIDWWSTQIDTLAQQGEPTRDFVGNSEVTGKQEIIGPLNIPKRRVIYCACCCVPPLDIEPKNGVPGTDPQDRHERKPTLGDEVQNELENKALEKGGESIGKLAAKKLAPHVPGVQHIIRNSCRGLGWFIEAAFAVGHMGKWAGQHAINPPTALKEIHETLPSKLVALAPHSDRDKYDPNIGFCRDFVSKNVEFYGKLTAWACGDDTWYNIWN